MTTPSERDAEKDRARARDRLRREILAAQVTVALNEELNREAPAPVKRLANVELPAMKRS